MCGRSSLTKTEKELEARFNATFYSDDLEQYNPIPNYNIAPTHFVPVITNQDPNHFSIFKWGLIPFWAKTPKIGYKMINSRLETILEKTSFKRPFQHQRCLIPLDGFYEWKTDENKKKVPYRIEVRDQKIFTVAGIWEKWRSPANELIHSFSIITMSANELMADIHQRMPAILSLEDEKIWLSNDLSAKDLHDLLLPYPSENMKAFRVSTRVNNVRNNDKSLLIPVDN